jgi:hypothetical protein
MFVLHKDVIYVILAVFNVCSCYRNAAQVEGLKKAQALKEHNIPTLKYL